MVSGTNSIEYRDKQKTFTQNGPNFGKRTGGGVSKCLYISKQFFPNFCLNIDMASIVLQLLSREMSSFFLNGKMNLYRISGR